MARKAVVEYVGDADSLIRATKKAQTTTQEFGRKSEEASKRAAEGFHKVREAAKLVAEIGGITALTFGLKDVTEEAVNAEAEQRKLANTVKDAGISWKAHSGSVNEWLDKTSRASGFVKSDLTAAFGNFVRTTGSVTKAQKLENEAMDVARSKGVSLASAQSLLARVYNGSYTGLKRLGIAVKPVTTAQDTLKSSTKNATDAQKAHAKQLDASATRTRALGIIQQKFGGQAEAYSKSTAGSFERAKASLNLFEEEVGKVVLPLMAKAADAISSVAENAEERWPEIKEYARQAFDKVKPYLDDIGHAAVVVGNALRPVANDLIAFAKGVRDGTGAGGAFRQVVVTAFTDAARVIKTVSLALYDTVKGFKDGKGWAVAIGSAVAGATAAFVAYKVAVTAISVATRTWAAITKAMTAVQAALDVVMDANPIGLVVLAIVALSAAFTVAYKKSDVFRKAIDGALNAVKSAVGATVGFIKAHWPLILSILTGPFGAVTIYVIRHFGTIRDTVKALPGKILNAMKDVGSTLLGVGSDLISGLLNGIKSKAGDVISTVKTFVTDKIPGFVKKALGIKSPSTVMARIGEQIGEGLRNGIAAGRSALTAATKAGLLDPIDAAIAALNAKKDALQKTWDAIDARAQRSQLVQAIATAKAGTVKTTTSGGGSGSAAGVSDSGGVAATILAVGKAMGASAKQIKAAIETGIVESGLKNLNYGDADSMGWRQERVSLYGKAHATNVKQSAIDFFSEARGFGGATPGQLAANVQRPAQQYRGRYDQVAGKAQAIIDSLTGGRGAGSSGGGKKTTKTKVIDASAVKDAKKALDEFDKAAQRAKKQARIDIQVKNLEQLKAFKDATKGVRDRLTDMAASAAAAWRTLRESEIDKAHDAAVKALGDTDQAKELARLQQQDSDADDAKTKAGLDKALADAKASGDVTAIQGAEDDIAAYQRKKREDELSAWITNETTKADTAQQTAKDGLDTEEADYKTSLDNRLGALADNLASGKESYAQFAKDVQGVLDGLHLPAGIPGFEGTGDEEATINAGPGSLGLSPAQGAAKAAAVAAKAHSDATHAAAIAAAKKRKPKRAAGGPVLAGGSYMVGELGPETFVPDSDGRVVPNGRGGRGGGLTIMGNVIIGNQKAARIFNNRLAHKVAFG